MTKQEAIDNIAKAFGLPTHANMAKNHKAIKSIYPFVEVQPGGKNRIANTFTFENSTANCPVVYDNLHSCFEIGKIGSGLTVISFESDAVIISQNVPKISGGLGLYVYLALNLQSEIINNISVDAYPEIYDLEAKKIHRRIFAELFKASLFKTALKKANVEIGTILEKLIIES